MGSYQQLHLPHGEKPSSPGNTGNGYFRSIRACPWLACGFLSMALLHLLCCSPAGSQRAVVSPLLGFFNSTYSVSTERGHGQGCRDHDYSEGRWVWEPGHARQYNGTECNVKDSENCVRNGRPDTGYLDWRWQPSAPGCRLPAFDAAAFLAAVRGKHVAFVGDSMARNQAESLVCLLGASVPYRLVYRDPEPGTRKFWRWAFPSHNVTVSVYWAPFLARATGRVDNYTMTYCNVYLDKLAERWSAEADTMDVAVVSIGHWFWNAVVYYNGSAVLGVHNLPESNHTEIGFFAPFREVIRKSVERLSSGSGGRTVVLSTFSPPHFEKPWNDPTTCARTEPYKDGEKEVGSEAAELRRIVKEEAAAAAARNGGGTTTIKVMDVTKLAAMRPDGHPGAYMWRDPFAPGMPKGLLNDCLHFCLPGPVDTFNEILLQLLAKRQRTLLRLLGRPMGLEGRPRATVQRHGVQCQRVRELRPEWPPGHRLYLDWRWQPVAAGCHLPAFNVAAFLAAVRGKHVAYVGDSMALSQAESLVCLLGASSFPYRLVYRNPAEPGARKFRRWAFPSHNVTVSSYWAPFLARVYTDTSVRHDALAEGWSADADTMDVAVISTVHWLWNQAVYYNGRDVLVAPLLERFNHTRIGFFSPYREAIRMSIDRHPSGRGQGAAGRRTVVVTTISYSRPRTSRRPGMGKRCARGRSHTRRGRWEVPRLAAELTRIAMGEASAAAAARTGGEMAVRAVNRCP
ncbi:hypothetical protein EJB05_45497 [Eragrostis curvula]|uniref:Uncharacterized protein n=1 Tax=Eragrostis curvula TaxID=38414 RepID=A0A5J9TL36_9POAL|nr:hypothetical protein EJB05_45497 [Eragrostis curvula]